MFRAAKLSGCTVPGGEPRCRAANDLSYEMKPIQFMIAASCAALFCLSHASAQAQAVYKWTDANGKVHYGDRAAAPQSSKAMHVAVAPAVQTQAPADAAARPQPHTPLAPRPDAQQKSMPVDPARVGPQCKGLIEQIAAVPSGTSWQGLSRQFDSACPGIAYECLEYRSNPQKNACTWVVRAGGNVLNRKSYP